MPTACVCEGAGLVETIRADLDRYVYNLECEGRTGWSVFPRIAILSPGLWASTAYRVAHYALTRLRPRPLGLLIGTLAFLAQRVLLALTGIEIDTGAHLGPGLLIPHPGNLVIGAIRTGSNCIIAHGVTLGRSTMMDGNPLEGGTPTLGDRVWIGPGAVIAGGLGVGSDAAVGANSVLLRDVPPRAVVLGIPARVVSWRGSFAQVAYRSMLSDPERAAALAAAGEQTAGEQTAGEQTAGEQPARSGGGS